MSKINIYNLTGSTVFVEDGKFNRAMKDFQRKVNNSGVMKELQEHAEYTKPSVEKKLAKKRAIKEWRKKQRNSEPK